MSALVAYDSSSEEDEGFRNDSELTTVSEAPISSLSKSIGQDEAEALATNVDRPMVGPSIPSGASQTFTSYEFEAVGDSADSERDIIRYLTQASHPMTEMPPSPPGSPDAASSAKFKYFLKLKADGTHFNEDLARKSVFKNPMLLQSLMQRAGLDSVTAYQTSLPLNVLNTTSLPAAGYKEALLQSQQSIRSQDEVERKALAAAGKRNIEFTSGGLSAASSASSTPGGFSKRQRQ